MESPRLLLDESLPSSLVGSMYEEDTGHTQVLPDSAEIVSSDTDNNEDNQYNATLREGDTGFLSFPSLLPLSQFDVDPALHQFSPIKSPLQDTQFSPRRRFAETPSTVGKKRDSAGNMLKTPVVSRNPLSRRKESVTDASGMSQIFANTQAATSPTIGIPTTVMRSDRPSPELEIERRLARSPASSPIPPLSDIKRTAAEPSDQYLPVELSQKRRNARHKLAQQHAYHTWSTLSPGPTRLEKFDKSADISRSKSSPMRSSPTRSVAILKAPTWSSANVSLPQDSSKSLPSSPPSLGAGHCLDLSAIALGGMTVQSKCANENVQHLDYSIERVVPNTVVHNRIRTRNTIPLTQPSPSTQSHYDYSVSNVIQILNSQRSTQSTKDRKKHSVKDTIDSIDVVPASPLVALVATQPPTLDSALQPDSTDGSVESDFGKIRGIEAIARDAQCTPPPQTVPEDHIRQPTSLDKREKGRLERTSDEPMEAVKSDITAFGSQIVLSPTGKNKRSQPGDQQNLPQFESSQPPVKRRRRLAEASQEDGSEAEPPTSYEAASVFDLCPSPYVAGNAVPWQYGDTELSNKQMESRCRDGRSHNLHEDQAMSTRSGLETGLRARAYVEPPSSSHFKHGQTESTGSSSNSIARSKAKLVTQKSVWDIQASPTRNHQTDHSEVSFVDAKTAKAERGRRSVAQSPKIRKLPIGIASTINPSPSLSASSEQQSVNSCSEPPVQAQDMVFAYYMGRSRAYYPARCVRSLQDDMYSIEWPGYAAETLADHQICSLDLRIGDEVKVDHVGFARTSYIIRGFVNIDSGDSTGELTDIYGHKAAILSLKQKKGMGGTDVTNEPVPIENIFIDLNAWRRISKRPSLYVNHIPQYARLPPRLTPPFERSSSPMTPSTRGHHGKKETVTVINDSVGVFEHMAFALSFELDNDRHKIRKVIFEHGGTIIEQSFRELLTDDMELKPQYERLKFTALLADRHSRKVKYLEALALGLPCLSGQWALASTKTRKAAPWQDYLLPAGECSELGGAVRSRILPASLDLSSDLTLLLASRSLFFKNTRSIFVTGKGKSASNRSTHHFFAHAMGACDIERVADLDAVQEKLLISNDSRHVWLFIDEKDRVAAHKMLDKHRDQEACGWGRKKAMTKKSMDVTETVRTPRSNISVADSEFVVQSLILGKLLPLDV